VCPLAGNVEVYVSIVVVIVGVGVGLCLALQVVVLRRLAGIPARVWAIARKEGGDPLRPPVDHRTGIRTSV
jgi:hypothetical protein